MKRTHRLLALLLTLSMLLSPVLCLPVSAAEIVPASEEAVQYLTLAQAGELISSCMAAREDVPEFYVIIENSNTMNDNKIYETLIAETVWHTGVPGKGDELRWVYSGGGYSDIEDSFDGQTHRVKVTGLGFAYYTTAQQEKVLNDRIDRLMVELDIASKTDYEKVYALYDYVCRNVRYSDDFIAGTLEPDTEAYYHVHTAYGALINGSAVCQGFSSLMYRLLLKAGLDARLIAGDQHGWNIVKLGDLYYCLDATWDSDVYMAGLEYQWFLKGSANFQSYGHAPWPEYCTEEYLDAYPISPLNYGVSAAEPSSVLGSGSCGENATWTLTGDGTLTISGTGATWDSETSGILWQGLHGHVKSVVIEPGITSIGGFLFYNFPQLSNVTIPATVTAIGNDAFGLCDSLETFTVPDTVTSLGAYCFSNCSRLREVKLSKSITVLPEGLFKNSQALQTLDIPQGVTEIQMHALANCIGLESVTIPNSVKTLGIGAFAGAFNPDKDTALVIPESVTEVADTCFAWSYLKEVTWNAKAARMEFWTFYNMPYLRKAVINGPLTYLGEEAFQHCASLVEVSLPDTVAQMENTAFGCCINLKKINLPAALEVIPNACFLECVSLESVVIPSATTVIEKNAFQSCSGLKTVVIPENVQKIGEFAFGWCYGLTSITFLGDAPAIVGKQESEPSFHGVFGTGFYPANNNTWTPEVRDNFSDTIRWIIEDPNHTAHTPEGQWYVDSEKHWQWCAGCDEYATVAAHEYSNCGDYMCDFCGYCRDLKDIGEQEHNWLPADCTKPKTCSVCEKTTGDLGFHIYSDGVDGTCNVCGIHRETTEDRTVMHMFRMYDPNSGEHFYTGSEVERQNLIDAGWNYEGVGFTFSRTTGLPVYRLYDPATGEHLYTMSEDEKATLMAQGWNFEGIAFNSAYDTEVPQYRLHNPNATRGAYHFTASTEERDFLLSIGWEDQGIGFYSSWK